MYTNSWVLDDFGKPGLSGTAHQTLSPVVNELWHKNGRITILRDFMHVMVDKVYFNFFEIRFKFIIIQNLKR